MQLYAFYSPSERLIKMSSPKTNVNKSTRIVDELSFAAVRRVFKKQRLPSPT